MSLTGWNGTVDLRVLLIQLLILDDVERIFDRRGLVTSLRGELQRLRISGRGVVNDTSVRLGDLVVGVQVSISVMVELVCKADGVALLFEVVGPENGAEAESQFIDLVSSSIEVVGLDLLSEFKGLE